MFEKMKGLTPKKKVEYFLMYYGWITVVIIGAIILVVSLIVNACSAKDCVGGVLVMNAYEDMTDDAENHVDGYLEEVAEEYGFNTSKEKIDLYTGIYLGDHYDSQSTYAGLMKVQTLLSTASADVVLFDDNYDTYSTFFDALDDIRKYLPEDILAENEDNLVWYQPVAYDEEEAATMDMTPYPVAIKINPDSKLAKLSNYYPNNNGYIGICASVISSKEMVKGILMDALK